MGFLKWYLFADGLSWAIVSLVMAYVDSPSFLVLLNGSPDHLFVSSRGLRQGDPLFPLLFFFVTEGLFVLLQEVDRVRRLLGVAVSLQNLVVSNFLFSDDSILFLKDTVNFAHEL